MHIQPGSRIRVYWQGNRRWFSGTVDEYDAASDCWLVKYDDGEQQLEPLTAPNLPWELLRYSRPSGRCPIDRETGKDMVWDTRLGSWQSAPGDSCPDEPEEKEAAPLHGVANANRPPAPTDLELLELPVGMCRRYQQGRCHKGRACKWKHEFWSVLQARWDEWHRQRACAAAGGSSADGVEGEGADDAEDGADDAGDGEADGEALDTLDDGIGVGAAEFMPSQGEVEDLLSSDAISSAIATNLGEGAPPYLSQLAHCDAPRSP